MPIEIPAVFLSSALSYKQLNFILIYIYHVVNGWLTCTDAYG